MNRLVRAAAVLAVACWAMLAGATSASAHSALESSSPADQAALTAAPAAITLTFNEPVNTQFSTVVVTGPDGTQLQDGAADVTGNVVIQPLLALTADGSYTIAYRVVSADGHPVDGELGFTLALPASAPTSAPEASTGAPPAATTTPTDGTTTTTAAAAGPSAAGTAAGADPAATDGGGSGATTLIVVLAVAALLLGVGAFALRRHQARG